MDFAIIYSMDQVSINILNKRLDMALVARGELIDADRRGAIRLFNGFYEGYPDLVIDLYDRTLVLYNYGKPPDAASTAVEYAKSFMLDNLPWVTCAILKTRFAAEGNSRKGKVVFGGSRADKVMEFGVWYAVDLLMNQDASFYIDTRNLRQWLLENAHGWDILNMFAYTGSLGVAALAGNAASVVQVDRSRKFLGVARISAMINRLDLGKMKLITADFYSQVAHYKSQRKLFDCVIVDPPFFSTTDKGEVNLAQGGVRVINKVRPLIEDGGLLVTINNALYLSGAEYMRSLERLCEDGYLSIEKIIPIPTDITGYSNTIHKRPPKDPSPFNHATKIVILRVRRKRSQS